MLQKYNMSRMKNQDAVFKALADHKRRQILDLLKDGRKTTGELCQHFSTWDRCTVMQHLRILEKAGLVIVKREGRIRWNYLQALPMREIYIRWIHPYASYSLEILSRMKRDIDKNHK